MANRLLPAEWAPQSAMLLVWPRAGGDWGGGLDAARATIAQAVHAVARTQSVVLVASDQESLTSIEGHHELANAKLQLKIVQIATNDVWIRDFGPISVYKENQRVFVDCRFNGWAGKYPATWDDKVAQELIEQGYLGNLGSGDYHRRDYILEGGAIESDGAGTLMITRCCLLESPRNPGDSEQRWNQRFKQDFGIERVHWLDHGHLDGDDTDGHVDTLARFVAQDTIVYQGCEDANDSHYQALQKMAAQLMSLNQANGKPYKLHALPLPQPIFEDDEHDDDGRRLPAGYANFLIANSVVLVPQYGDPADAEALKIIATCFPNREVVGLDCMPLIRQNGAIHCAAMQIPKEFK